MTNCQVMEDNSICFNFWFEMTHSSGIEKLEIHMEGERDLTRIKVWEFQQKHLDFWEEGRVELHKLAHEDFKIVIVAERGDLQSGYVALDDFHFETSEQEEFCSIKPPVRCCTLSFLCTLSIDCTSNRSKPKKQNRINQSNRKIVNTEN